jgi:oligoendopeptidase F
MTLFFPHEYLRQVYKINLSASLEIFVSARLSRFTHFFQPQYVYDYLTSCSCVTQNHENEHVRSLG